MLKLFLGLFFISILLNASTNENQCERDLNTMMSSYYIAQKEYDDKNYEQAMLIFSKTKDYSYVALESCQDYPKYDFNIIYNYIIACEDKIYKIQIDIID